MGQNSIEPLATAKDIGEILHLDEAEVLQLANDGILPFYELGSLIRFRISEVEAALQKRRRHGSSILADSSVSSQSLPQQDDSRRHFWESLLKRSRARTSLHAHISAGNDSWIATTAGRRGLFYQYGIRNDAVSVMLYIDGGVGSDVQNTQIMDALYAQKADIERTFGAALEWDRKLNRRACIIRYSITSGGLRDQSRWVQTQDEAIDAMIRLEKALRGPVANLEKSQ